MALTSTNMVGHTYYHLWKLDSSFLNHIASQLAEQAMTYFASAILSAMQYCFLLNQEITPDPILKQHP